MGFTSNWRVYSRPSGDYNRIVIITFIALFVLAIVHGSAHFKTSEVVDTLEDNNTSHDATVENYDNMSLAMADAVIEKILVSDSPNLPDSVTEQEYSLALKTKFANVNHDADGITEPWRGDINFVQPGDERLSLLRNLRFSRGIIYVLNYYDIDDDGTVVSKEIPLKFESMAKCVSLAHPQSKVVFIGVGDEDRKWRSERTGEYSKRVEKSCGVYLDELTSAGSAGNAQVYGVLNEKHGWIDVSKIFFPFTSDISFDLQLMLRSQE